MKKERIILFTISVLVSTAIFLSIRDISFPKRACKTYASPIKAVGGCTGNGNCGVMLEDGTVLSDVYQPVVGAKLNGARCHLE